MRSRVVRVGTPFTAAPSPGWVGSGDSEIEGKAEAIVNLFDQRGWEMLDPLGKHPPVHRDDLRHIGD